MKFKAHQIQIIKDITYGIKEQVSKMDYAMVELDIELEEARPTEMKEINIEEYIKKMEASANSILTCLAALSILVEKEKENDKRK